jgi:transposase
MSMHPQPIGPVPENTARVARAAFTKGTTYVQLRDVLGAIYDDEDFAQLFEVRGRSASRRGGRLWLRRCSSRRAFR